jgi:integrase/recombinase XerD
MKKRTPARQKAIELAKYLRKEQLDYTYLKEVFRYLRKELEIKVTVEPKEQKEVYIPTEEEIQNIIKLYGNQKIHKIW